MFAGPSPADIKNERQRMDLSCTTCFKAGHNFKRCEKCKTAYYCSKECQKADWPRHKQFCKTVEGSGLTKILESLMGNKLLYLYMQIMLALEFDIPNNPDLVRKPFMARIDIVVEPAKLEDLYSLLKPNASAPKTMQGILQLTKVISPCSGGSNLPLTAMRQTMWETFRKAADEAGNANCPVGLVEFVNNSPQSTTVPIFISSNAISMARDKLPALVPVAGNTILSKTASVYNYMEYINASIRFDTENRWLLRRNMKDSDKQIIRDVASNHDIFAARYFKEKMERESIYIGKS